MHLLGFPYLVHGFALLCFQSMIDASRHSTYYNSSWAISTPLENSRVANTCGPLLKHVVLLLGHC